MLININAYVGYYIYFWPNNEKRNIHHQKWVFHCLSKYSPACAQTNCRSSFSTPIEAPPKKVFKRFNSIFWRRKSFLPQTTLVGFGSSSKTHTADCCFISDSYA
uniref:Uncharacterized protein n=1 Tax=Lepeophtheirus salmonis TaxID=72036 RepID=A0A0K2V423_LEPSM